MGLVVKIIEDCLGRHSHYFPDGYEEDACTTVPMHFRNRGTRKKPVFSGKTRASSFRRNVGHQQYSVSARTFMIFRYFLGSVQIYVECVKWGNC
ncbi:hypothetical protein BDZ91DRAFT_734588 [Kalaharituber pfeilii]|nr:hypothetical protein BDZ91DRAFT_734588 [Kalaharituber pfeilii]